MKGQIQTKDQRLFKVKRVTETSNFSAILVSCNGEDQNSQHPKIYLTLTSQVVCPYCSNVFAKS